MYKKNRNVALEMKQVAVLKNRINIIIEVEIEINQIKNAKTNKNDKRT